MNEKMHPYKAVLFDLDGTLVNSLTDIADSMNRVLKRKGYLTHDYDAYRFFIGRGLHDLVVRSLPESAQSEPIINNLFQELLSEYETNLLNKTNLYTGIAELLDALSSRNIRICILSNKADAFTKTITANLLSKWPIEQVLGSSDAFPRKPDPTSALHLCNIMGLSPQDFLYVGDTSIDMETACAAGMYPVGVTWGFRSKKELLERGAKKLIDQPLDLLNLLDLD